MRILIRNIIILLLLGLAVFGIVKYIILQREKYDLLESVKQMKVQLAQLENEKQGIKRSYEEEKALHLAAQEKNVQLEGSLKSTQEQLDKITLDYQGLKEDVEKLNAEVSAVKAEKTFLAEENDELQVKLSGAKNENESLIARLTSIPELKKAIRELKKQMRNAGHEIKKKIMSEKKIIGNQGFVIKQGQPTVSSKVKIEVQPAEETR
ncbi:hypothetical protein EPO66_04360 [bacterium]|nr:MAG: hypothetical protein EPO66_04360 [bacterium]